VKTVARVQDLMGSEELGTEEAVLPARVQEALGQLVGVAREGLLALSVGVGLGVLVELMESEVVRHEALLDRAGCETPTAGCRSGLWKLRAAWTRSCGRGWDAALTTTGRAVTIGGCGPGKRGREA
jgi:hypothetical protein